MSDHAASPPYRFSGITDYVPTTGVKPSFAVKIPGLFLVGRVADALSQVPAARPEDRAGMYAVAQEGIDGLKAALATVEAAMADVKAHCPVPEPEPEPEPEPVIVAAVKPATDPRKVKP